MRIKIITKMLILSLLSTLVNAGEISGRIELKENGQLRTEEGQIFVGEIEHEHQISFRNFPSYLKSMLDAIKNRRMSPITDGSFLIQNVPVNKKLIVGVSFTDITYFMDATIKNNSLKIEEVIDLGDITKELKVSVKNETGKTFKSEFASLSYLIEEGSKGRIFSGKKNKLIINFGAVPIGRYKLYVLNEEEVDTPNRVDSMTVDLTVDTKREPILFTIK